MNNFDWCENSNFCEDVDLKTYFGTNFQYYFGDPNSSNFEDFDDPEWHLDLPTLSFNPDKNEFTDADAIIGNEAEFGAYYRKLIELAYEHNHSFNTIRHYFWLRSLIVSKEEDVSVGFPWYDSNADSSRMFNWITSGTSGETFTDLEQGWTLEGVIKDNKIYFFETDGSDFNNPMEAEFQCNTCFNLHTLRQQVNKNQKTVQSLIAKLTAEIGIDVWSKYHDKENLKFGTSTWKPKNPSKLGTFIKTKFSKT